MMTIIRTTLCITLAAMSAVGFDAAAQTTRISGSMQANGDIKSPWVKMTPNGAHTLFIADAETEGVDELYVVPSAGGARTKISNTAVRTQTFFVSPDSNRVVFTATPSIGILELFSVNISGAGFQNLSAIVGNVPGLTAQPRISPDGTRVVFLAKRDSATQDELYSVPIAGGAVTKLSPPLIAGANVQSDFDISADSTRVVFRATTNTVTDLELWSAPIANANSAIRISNMLVANGDVQAGFVISPNSTRVVYWANQDDANVAELYSAPIAQPSAAVKISGFMTSGGNVTGDFVISPDSSRVVFRADKTTNDTFEIYSVPLAGGGAIPLLGPITAGGGVPLQSGIPTWMITPDSQRVVFKANKDNVAAFELYSVPINAGVLPTKLSGTLTPNGNVQDYLISPDSQRVVFRADRELNDVYELYSVPTAGGTVVKLSGTMTNGGNVVGPPAITSPRFFAITPDSARVVFMADKDTDTVNEVYATSITSGGQPIKISGPLVSGGNVSGFVVSPNSTRVTFWADKDNDSVLEVFTTSANGLAMDVDGNGVVDALTDGLLLLRWQFGLKGNALIAGAIGANATRTNAVDIEAYLTKLDSLAGPN